MKHRIKMNNFLTGSLIFVFALPTCPSDLSARGSQSFPINSGMEDLTKNRASYTYLPQDSKAPEDAKLLFKYILNGHADIRDRLEAVDELGHNLNHDEINFLLSFLKERPDSKEKNIAGLRTLKNNILNALRFQKLATTGLSSTLIELFYDSSQDFVMRDYAIQHMASWYGQGASDAPDAKSRIQRVLNEATSLDTSLAGTALLGLHRLSQASEGLSSKEIDQIALRMVSAPNLAIAARITAVQICAERGLIQAHSEIARLAEERGQTALQISAIAALGKLGSAKDILLLRKIENKGNIALRLAIASALRQLPLTLLSREGL